MSQKKEDNMQTNYSMQQIAYLQTEKKKKYSTLFSSPPRGRCLIQRIKTEKSNYSCGMGETQLQRGTALTPVGPSHATSRQGQPMGRARGGSCSTSWASPPMLNRGCGMGSSPEAALRCTKAQGRGDACTGRAYWGQFYIFFF